MLGVHIFVNRRGYERKNNLLIFILTIGVFGIINTEMGVLGILPLLAEKFSISIAQAGSLVSLFALEIGRASCRERV